LEAISLYHEGVQLCLELDNRRTLAICLEGLAEIAISQGDVRRAARLLGAAGALRDALGEPLPPINRPAYERHVAALRVALGRKGFAEATAQGRALSTEQVIAEALAIAAQPSASVSEGGASAAAQVRKPAAARLSSREREVATLVAAGRTNQQIAAELHLAARTVDAHVSHILGKLGLASRVEVALWLKEQNLIDVAVT
jgi:non-specific serine/threonine protein kinase